MRCFGGSLSARQTGVWARRGAVRLALLRALSADVSSSMDKRLGPGLVLSGLR